MLNFHEYYARWAKLFRRRQPKRVRTVRLGLECLEDRWVPTTFTVTNVHDSGSGSLRQAILSSNANPAASGANLIDFNLPGNSSGEIVAKSALPALTSPVVINGIPIGGPAVVLVANNTSVANGFTVDASGCTIEALGIGGFGNAGILVKSNDNLIEGCSLGLLGGPDPNANGIVITGSDNTIGGTTATAANFIALNHQSGIVIDDGQHNQVEGNLIGAKANGQAEGNGGDGVKIEGAAAQYNTIGGAATGDANLISGNDGDGVAILSDATTNTVERDFIGTDLLGGTSQPHLGNHQDGVFVGSGANGNFIGSTITGAEGAELGVGNVISNNGEYGVEITGADTNFNFLISNFIGTNQDGADVGNRLGGVLIHGKATYNFVGGGRGNLGNFISGNDAQGVIISGKGTTGNFVWNNIIGATLDGAAALPNSTYGVMIEAGATGNAIGSPGNGNLISGNTFHSGVYIADVGTSGNTVEGNYIGTDGGTTGALPNLVGVTIGAGATGNTIGGTATGAANVISGNTDQGVVIRDAGTTGNFVEGNDIGTDLTGTIAVPNGNAGVAIGHGASKNTIGNTSQTAPNIISGNTGDGIDITGADNNVVEENFIGTDSSGTLALGNGVYGVLISGGAKGNTVGDGNVISGNTLDGVHLEGAGTAGNSVQNNFIGLNTYGTGAIPNEGSGIYFDEGASANSVNYNVISGNTGAGIFIYGPTTEDEGIHGNAIGTKADGITPLPNSYGVFIQDGANNNVIGGPAGGNTIADNTNAGVAIVGNGSVGNTISQNSIYGNGTVGIDLGNTGIPSTNAPGGPHTGPNHLQNYPVLTGIMALSNTSALLHGTLNSTPNSSFTIEFFSSPTGDQGETYLGSVTVETDSTGNASFTFTFTPSADDPYLTATATDANGNTSEFSAAELLGS